MFVFLCGRDVGVRLLGYFVDRSWTASARMVLTTLLQHAAPVASFRAVVSGVKACNGERLGLLHRAVRSGQMSAIVEVLGWAVQQQTCLLWNSKGPHGLTPLHLLALSGGKSSGSLIAGNPRSSRDLQSSLAALVLQTSPGGFVAVSGSGGAVACCRWVWGGASCREHFGRDFSLLTWTWHSVADYAVYSNYIIRYDLISVQQRCCCRVSYDQMFVSLTCLLLALLLCRVVQSLVQRA
jgi:hypothetical protein